MTGVGRAGAGRAGGGAAGVARRPVGHCRVRLSGHGRRPRRARDARDRIRVTRSPAGRSGTASGVSASAERSDNRRWRPDVQRSGGIWSRTLCSRYGAASSPVMDSAR
jgi:hypothetical protein